MWDKLADCWWGQILLGVFCFAIAIFMYWYISDLEATGRSGRAHWLIALVYNIAGKWPSVLVIAAMGLFFAGIGIRNLVVIMHDRDRD
jgi:hypothetical protein